jgi:hypothetical protein
MAAVSSKNRLIALAKLTHGTSPREVSEEIPEISYGYAVKLSKELKTAQAKNDLESLFRMPSEGRQLLLDAVRDNLTEDLADLVPLEELEGEFVEFADALDGLKMLDITFQKTADILARKIQSHASVATDVSSILVLTDALAKLQNAFFAKGTNVQVNNYSSTQFASLLKD